MKRNDIEKAISKFDKKIPLSQSSYSDGNGLTLIFSSNKAHFISRYTFEGKRGKIKIGEYPAMSINKAQALNNHIQNEISLGSSPQIVKQTFNKPPMARTVKELLKSYLEFHLTPNLKSGSKIHGIIENHIIPVIGEIWRFTM